MRLKFVHAADLHLDAPFVGLREADEEVSARLREATFRAYDRVIDLCLKEKVDFAVFAGDVFNSQNKTVRSQSAFAKGLGRLADAGIPAFIAHGNHDPVGEWSESFRWPTLARRFGAGEVEGFPVVRDGQVACQVYGISFPRQKVLENLALRFRRADGAPFAVGVLHANVGGQMEYDSYAPCSVADLDVVGLDYWALGHIHRRLDLKAARPAIVYAGNTQGLTPNEAGPRGCCLVTLAEDEEPLVEFRPTAPAVWRQEALSIAGVSGEQELVDAAEATIAGAVAEAECDLILLRLRLEGAGPLHGRMGRRDLEETLRDLGREASPMVWVESLLDETRPEIDLESRAGGEDFVGQFLRLAEAALGDAVLGGELQDEIGDLLREREVVEAVQPSPELVQGWLERARVLGAELMVREREA